MSLFGLHRALRGALVGHFACVEVTSSPGSRRLAKAMRRCGAGPSAEHFYAEHVEADAVHEQVVRHEVIGGLLSDEPDLEADIAFGCAATVRLEDRLATRLRKAWEQGRRAGSRPWGSGAPASSGVARRSAGRMVRPQGFAEGQRLPSAVRRPVAEPVASTAGGVGHRRIGLGTGHVGRRSTGPGPGMGVVPLLDQIVALAVDGGGLTA